MCLNEQGELAVTKFAVEPVSASLAGKQTKLVTDPIFFRSGIYLVLQRDLASVRLRHNLRTRH